MIEDKIVVVSQARTAIGRFGGSLKSVGAVELGAIALSEAISRANLEPNQVERVVAGENMQVTARGNPARQVLLKAGLPWTANDYTINMNCASGLRAMTCLAENLLTNDVAIGAAVGMENMSQSPYLLEGVRWGLRLGNGEVVDFLGDYILGDAGPMAEAVAEKYGISRSRQDKFAVESQSRARDAIEAGRFADDIVPVEILGTKGHSTEFAVDEHPRPDIDLTKLAKLSPAFLDHGTVTAGNSSGINDGAAAIIMMRESTAHRLGLRPRAVLKAWAAAGVDPALFGIGPVPATLEVMRRAGLKMEDLDLVEINEAFAASTLAAIDELNLDPDRTNVNGGAIALGHPVGATGLVLVIKLIGELERRAARLGLVTMCVGNGQGMSVVLERVA